MVKNSLVGKVKETIAKLPAHAQKDESVVSRERGEGREDRDAGREIWFVHRGCLCSSR